MKTAAWIVSFIAFMWLGYLVNYNLVALIPITMILVVGITFGLVTANESWEKAIDEFIAEKEAE